MEKFNFHHLSSTILKFIAYVGLTKNSYEGERSTFCKNCTKPVVKGIKDRGTIGLEGSFVNRYVAIFIEKYDEWFDGAISKYDPSLEGKWPNHIVSNSKKMDVKNSVFVFQTIE